MTSGFSNDKSIYLQIAAMIENDILRSILGEDEQAASTNELAKALNVNPNTAAKGINTLFTEGVLYKKRGVGMFVAPGAKEMILQKRRKEFFNAYVLPLQREAKTLGISGDELLNIIMEGFR